ncbi:MAG: hypothetical protein IPM39_14720 [Chloroflexi bacterium]|nr:hypothetical protein [Chloroflexota bacterium]
MSQENAALAFLRQNRRLWWLLPLLALLLLILVLAFVLPGAGEAQGLKPFRPTRVSGELTVVGDAALVSFTDLNAAPEAYRDQRLRVTGDYQRLTPLMCRPHNGPLFQWSLVAEALQLNAIGFESLLRNMPDGLSLTVEGIWRLYDGPLGCGKGAPRGTAWYLSVERIIAPNPLPNFRATLQPTGAPELIGDDTVTPTPTDGGPTEVNATPTPDPTILITPLATTTPALVGTPIGVTATATAGPGTVFPSVTPLVTPTNLPPGFPTVTPPGGATATLPATGGTPAPTLPPLPTSPGYPVPTPGGSTSTPTPSPSPYPSP